MRNALVFAALFLALPLAVHAQPTTAPVPPATPPATRPATQPADVPAPRINPDGSIHTRFRTMHESFLRRAREGPIGLLFLGDSITQQWADAGKQVWAERYAKHDAANFGISGDRTQYVLWRIANGELDGINPKVVVLLLGTNNTGSNTADEIAAGDAKIVGQIRAKLPDAKVILLAVFPRGPRRGNVEEAERHMKVIRAVNERLAKLDDGRHVRFLDLGPKLAPTGVPSPEVMPDGVHLSPQGYQIWADGMQPLLDELMGQTR